jgi:DNA-binding NtrC family response regulator
MQPKLLRVLEDRRVTRVGGRTVRPVDVRILAATNRDLMADVQSGAFRSDLYFRLSGFVLAIPALRERREEIAELSRALLARACAERGRTVPRLADAALARLEDHDWPGNVRELRNVMTRMLLLAQARSSSARTTWFAPWSSAAPKRRARRRRKAATSGRAFSTRSRGAAATKPPPPPSLASRAARCSIASTAWASHARVKSNLTP